MDTLIKVDTRYEMKNPSISVCNNSRIQTIFDFAMLLNRLSPLEARLRVSSRSSIYFPNFFITSISSSKNFNCLLMSVSTKFSSKGIRDSRDKLGGNNKAAYVQRKRRSSHAKRFVF